MSATATPSPTRRTPVPRDRDNDYTHEAAERRREFIRDRTGASLEHVSSYSFDPEILSGNVEQFIGVAQVPIGLAGPLLVHGEHAQGEFYVPLPRSGSPLTTCSAETAPPSPRNRVAPAWTGTSSSSAPAWLARRSRGS